MTSRKRCSASLCFVLAMSQVAWIPMGCADRISGGSGSGGGTIIGAALGSLNLGQVVFDITRSQLEQAPDNAVEKVAALDRNHAPFVSAVNTIVAGDALVNLGLSAQDLFALVDDDTLPNMAADVAQILEELAADSDATAAIATLSGARTVVQTEDVVSFLGRLMAYPQIEETVAAIAELVADNDGVDAQGLPNGEPTLVSDLLRFVATELRKNHALGGSVAAGSSTSTGSSSSSGSLIGALSDELLAEVTMASGVDLGAPSWCVRVDSVGNPAVATDPATGTLFAPFVDADLDGVADVDADSRPVDVFGAPISIEAFGTTGQRDGWARALTPGGQLIYSYFDAKRTLVGLLLRNLGQAFGRDVPGAAVRALMPAFGPMQINDNGTPLDPSDDFEVFADDNPVSDLSHGVLEIMKYDELPKLLEALAELLEQNPDTGEAALVHLGRAMERLQAVPAASSSLPGASTAFDTMVPLLDDLLERQGQSPSTARLLIDVLHSLGQAARDLPAELAPLMRFKSVVRESAPDGDRNGIDELLSDPVDPTLPCIYTDSSGNQVDNRTAMHRLLGLLDSGNQCNVFGKSLAVRVLEGMANRSPSTIHLLISMIVNVPGFIPDLICPGTGRDLVALNDLAVSGALDALLPIVKAFNDRGEVPLLAEILTIIHDQYDVNQPSGEDRTALVLESGAIEELLDLLGIATTVQVPSTGEVVADVIADALESLVDDDGMVIDRHGRQVPTLLHLAILPSREMEVRVAAAGGSGSADTVVQEILGLITARRFDDGGTPNDPSDDREVLENRSLVPCLARLLDLTSLHLGTDPIARAATISQTQSDITSFMADRPFAAMMDLAMTVDQSAAKPRFIAAFQNLLTPQANLADDALAALLKLVAGSMQVRGIDSNAASQLGRFLGDVLDPDRQLVLRLISGFERVLTRDSGRTVISVLRNALNEPAPGEEPPVTALVRIMDEIRSAAPNSGGVVPALTSDDIRDTAQGMVDFIRDPDQGLQRVWNFIRSRPRSSL